LNRFKPIAPFLLGALFCGPVTARAQESEPSPRDEVLVRLPLEVRPYGGWVAVPDSATRAFVGADVIYRFGAFFALGADAAWYGPFNRSAGPNPTYPLNETLDSAELDGCFFPFPARVSSGSVLWVVEPYVLAGIGVLESRPIPVVDPTDRHFTYSGHFDVSLGVGGRLFVVHRFAIVLEIRDTVYEQTLENSSVASDLCGVPCMMLGRENPATWYSPASRLTNTTQLRLGVSLFL
jgi:hypothetical protein